MISDNFKYYLSIFCLLISSGVIDLLNKMYLCKNESIDKYDYLILIILILIFLTSIFLLFNSCKRALAYKKIKKYLYYLSTEISIYLYTFNTSVCSGGFGSKTLKYGTIDYIIYISLFSLLIILLVTTIIVDLLNTKTKYTKT